PREESIPCTSPTLYSDARGRSGRTGRGEPMRVGFVGLGAMGMHMARNLHRAGMLAAVWNRSAAKARTLASELNVASPATLEQLAASTDAVVSCVSADADVLEVARGLAPGVKSVAPPLDCSTSGAVRARAGVAARETDRHPRPGRGLELVLRAPRAQHGARLLPGGLPGASAREGSRHLPGHGGALRRRPAPRGAHARRVRGARGARL